MKTILALALLTSLSAHAEEIYTANGKEITKGEAILVLAKDPKTSVKRTTDMKLNLDKGTLTKK